MTQPYLQIRRLRKTFRVGNDTLTAVNDLSLDIYPGETLGLVGESGCGKSTVGRCILRLHQADKGELLIGQTDLMSLPPREMKAMRRRIQMVFQDPYASLNPRMTVGDIVGEAMDIHRIKRGDRVASLLEQVGLHPEHASRYPHEFSGGQRQRIGLARALAVEPEFLVCDEPVSALDVSIQAQIINLFKKIQREKNLTYLFIAHDLALVQHISDRVAVMYLGNLVELAPSEALYLKPQHPYTQALLSAIPIPDPKVERSRDRIVLSGDLPSPLNPPKACPFHSRCPIAQPICKQEKPEWRELSPGHFAACHFA